MTQTFSDEKLRFYAMLVSWTGATLTSIVTLLIPFLTRRQKSLMERSKRETRFMKLMDDAADKADRALAVAEHVADPVKQNQVAQEALLQITQILRSK